MIKGIFALALLLMMVCPSIAADLCTINFYVDVPVHVIDKNYMDAQGVNVTVTYQKRSNHFTPGPEYVTTEPKTTNASGMAQFLILNTVPNSQYLDCKLKINVSFLNYSKVDTVNLNHFFNAYTVNISAKEVTINLKDGAGLPISARLVLYPDNEYAVNGSISLLMPYGPTPGFMVFNGHRQSIVINVNNATPDSLDVVFKTYALNVVAFDDFGNAIPFSVQAGNETQSSGSGPVTIRLVDSPSTIKVSAAGRDIYREVNPEANANETFYVDVHAPIISNIRVSPANDGRLEISYLVSDPGKRASGIMDTGVYINDVYYPAVSALGIAKVTITPKGGFSFNVTATDNAGNRADVSGTYTEGSVPIINSTGNNSGNESGTNSVSAGGGSDNTMLIILGVIVVIILAIMLKRGGGESSDSSV